MTQEEVRQRIQSLENRIQRMTEEISRDDAAILKCESSILSDEQILSRATSQPIINYRQKRIAEKKKEKQRKQEQKNRHQQELNRMNRALLAAKRQMEQEGVDNGGSKHIINAAPMDKIYQIFVSSTYEDLKEERQEVMAAVVSTGNVPIGMEYFPAGDAAPFDYIKKQIDDADYYILVVAGKYGSINKGTGISYTEMEFDYAIEKKVPVAVLLYRDLNKLTADKIELDNDRRCLLEAFRNKVREGRMANFWDDKKDLRSEVKDAINSMIVESPRTGWIRADRVVIIQQETSDNQILDEQIKIDVNLDEGTFYLSDEIPLPPDYITLKEILDIAVPAISTPKTEAAIDEAFNMAYHGITEESLTTIKAILLKHKFVETNTLINPNDGVYTAWSVTPLGRSLWAQTYKP